MNKYLVLIMTAFIFTIQKAYCVVEAVSPDLNESLKPQMDEPNVMTIILALLFVIVLIYITGIIYSKLNIVGAKAVKEQLKHADLNRAMVVSTTQLGQNKNLHVIEINNKNYLIGATPNSINLIKELGDSKKEKKEVEEPQKPNEEEIDKAIKYLYGRNHEEIIEAKPEDDQEEFNIHKKYL